MINFILIILTYILTRCASTNLGVQPRVTGTSARKVIIHDYGQCRNYDPKNLAVEVIKEGISYRAQNLIVTGNITIKEDLPKDFYISITETKCPIKTGVCSFHGNDTMMYICPLVNFASKNIKPNFKCPLKKNRYEVRSVIISIGALLLLPIENNRWKLEIRLMSKKTTRTKERMLGCVFIDGSVLPAKAS